jgi:threonyl-tRNA synthetase
MARAVMRLYPNVQLAFGPNVENGFYYDFSMEHRLTEEDFPKIEAEMKTLIKLNEEFERIEMPINEAVELLEGIGQTLKVEHIRESLAGNPQPNPLPEGEGTNNSPPVEGCRDSGGVVSIYRQGEFIDLCRGPHIERPRAIGAFKLMSIAGA